jgi:hypothetical protein
VGTQRVHRYEPRLSTLLKSCFEGSVILPRRRPGTIAQSAWISASLFRFHRLFTYAFSSAFRPHCTSTLRSLSGHQWQASLPFHPRQTLLSRTLITPPFPALLLVDLPTRHAPCPSWLPPVANVPPKNAQCPCPPLLAPPHRVPKSNKNPVSAPFHLLTTQVAIPPIPQHHTVGNEKHLLSILRCCPASQKLFASEYLWVIV